MPPKPTQGRTGRFPLKRKSTYMRKTTARGAYKKPRKKQMMKRRAPFVETKSRTAEDVYLQYEDQNDRTDYQTYDTPHLFLNPDAFLMMTQGLQEDQMIGNSVFSKYINLKVQVRFSQHSFIINEQNKITPRFPQNYELIWGIVPTPMKYTNSTTPKANSTTIAEVHAHINQRVIDFFNERKDKLRFIPKKGASLRIFGRRKVRPDLRFQATAPLQTTDNVGEDTVVGSIPDYFTEISWKPMRKMHYERTNNLDGEGREGLFPNYTNFLPFCVLVNHDYELVEKAAGDPGTAVARQLYQPAVAWNSIHYYSDS